MTVPQKLRLVRELSFATSPGIRQRKQKSSANGFAARSDDAGSETLRQ
jgi:hypothetical protein